MIYTAHQTVFGDQILSPVKRMGERTGVYGVLVAKPEGKRQFGSPRRRWNDNTKMDLKEVEWWDMD